MVGLGLGLGLVVDCSRIPLTPVTSTTHGLAVREVAACSATGQLPSVSTRWKRSRNVASAGSESSAWLGLGLGLEVRLGLGWS